MDHKGVETEVESERTPEALREGLRSGIIDTIKQDVELRGGRTARRLAAAGIMGVTGAIGATVLVSTHPLGHHPPWHATFFSIAWAGLLVVCFGIVFLRVRTPTFPLARSVSAGILGLGLTGFCGAVCPDKHFLGWWSATGIGAPLTEWGGLPLSALCFGLVATFLVGAVAAALVLSNSRWPPIKALPPAIILLALLTPGVALQSVDTSYGVFVAWFVGTAVGALLGIASGIRVRALLPKS